MISNELAFQNWQNGLDWDCSEPIESNSIDTKTVIQLTLFCEELKQSNDMENTELISIEQAISMGDLAKGKRSEMVYIKPQSPIHSASDPWNVSQQYELITWDYLVRNYRYSCLEGRYYNAYNQRELSTATGGQ